MNPGRAVFWRQAAWLLALPLAPALATAWWHPRAPDWAARLDANTSARADVEIDLARIRSAFPDALWVDARSDVERNAGQVPGAIALSEDRWDAGFAALAAEWDGRRAVVVYCGGETCDASRSVALRLRRELGTERVYALRGGWTAWRAWAKTGEVDR